MTVIPSHYTLYPITVGVQVFPSANPIGLVFDQSSAGIYRQSISIEIRRDEEHRGNLQFQLSLRNTISGAVFFTRQNVTVTIIDIDGKWVDMVEAFV